MQTENRTSPPPVIEIRNLTQRFGGLTAVSDFNITLGQKQMAGLIGPNGAGKTTVFNLVSGFYQPSEGEILINGYPTAGLKPHKVTSLGVARTFQNIRLWNDMTVLDNIRVAQHGNLDYDFVQALLRTRTYFECETRIEKEAMELLEVFELDQFANEFPTNLPYGLQRKLEIVRALSEKPSLLLLDEPAAGLNTVDMHTLIRLIRWIYDSFDVTIWMIEHHMDVMMELCDDLKVIDFGHTIAEGNAEEIQNNPAVISAYLGDDIL
jgi:branched-chain amino acid transport system ATP-binding protein